MRMGRSKSKLVPKSYGPSRRLRGWRKVALLQVIAFGAARGVQAGNMRIPLWGGARHVRLSLAMFVTGREFGCGLRRIPLEVNLRQLGRSGDAALGGIFVHGVGKIFRQAGQNFLSG